LAILVGVLVKGKIDNTAHLIGFFMILVIIILAQVQLMIIPLIFLAIGAFLDEIGNDYIDKKKTSFNKNQLRYQFVIAFFEQRWVLKLVLLAIALVGLIPIYFFLAMLLFDYSYFMICLYSKSKQKPIDTEIKPTLQLSKFSLKKPRPTDVAED
jgi:hypothetical protein